MSEIYSSYIACEMISAMLSILAWVSSLIASCFLCYTVNTLKCIYVITVAREKSRLVLLSAVRTSKLTPFVNAAIKTPSVINATVVRHVSSTPVIDWFVSFFASLSKISILLRKYTSIWFFKWFVSGSCGAAGFRSGYILLVRNDTYFYPWFNSWK